MFAFGPKQTCAVALQESAFGSKADIRCPHLNPLRGARVHWYDGRLVRPKVKGYEVSPSVAEPRNRGKPAALGARASDLRRQD
jgi:hypothetical protein